MRVFFQIAYFVVGIVQFFAVWDGTELFIGAEAFFGKFFAFTIAALLTYIPLVGSAIGVYGATNVWDWSLTKSLILFFWYVPVWLVLVGGSALMDRR